MTEVAGQIHPDETLASAVTFADVQSAAARIAGVVISTSPRLSRRTQRMRRASSHREDAVTGCPREPSSGPANRARPSINAFVARCRGA